ncbi:hypothetical protein BJX99DRAFT_266238 [Aspergillus californicus]
MAATSSREERHNVVDKNVFLRGARLARDPTDTAGLPETEQKTVEKEREKGIFQQTKDLRVTILVTACAAITQGWQQSSINASSHRWQEDMGGIEYWENRRLRAGLTDALPWISGSLIGTWLSDPLQEGRYGRRRALFISGIFCTAFALGSAKCDTWIQLLICRLLLGFGIGAKASVAPVFAAEAAVDYLRGRLLMMWQLFDAFGIFVGFVCVFIVDMHWRIILGSAAVPSTVLLFLVFLCPESPRFLIRKSLYKEAFESLRQLRGSDIQACRDLYYIHSQLQFESSRRMELDNEEWLEGEIYQSKELADTTFLKRVKSLWSIPHNRRACLAAFIVMASQQLCGGDRGTEGEGDATRIAWLNFGFGLANFLFTIPAYWVIDGSRSKGRRRLLLWSLGGMFFTLIAISSCFLRRDDSVRRGLVTFFTIVVYLFFYGIGAGPVPFTFSAEVFPLAFREVGMSFSVMVNFLGLGLLVNFVPAITHAFNPDIPGTSTPDETGYESYSKGKAILLFIFTGLDALAFILVFLVVPNTGGITLEDMSYVCENSH